METFLLPFFRFSTRVVTSYVVPTPDVDDSQPQGQPLGLWLTAPATLPRLKTVSFLRRERRARLFVLVLFILNSQLKGPTSRLLLDPLAVSRVYNDEMGDMEHLNLYWQLPYLLVSAPSGTVPYLTNLRLRTLVYLNFAGSSKRRRRRKKKRKLRVRRFRQRRRHLKQRRLRSSFRRKKRRRHSKVFKPVHRRRRKRRLRNLYGIPLNQRFLVSDAGIVSTSRLEKYARSSIFTNRKRRRLLAIWSRTRRDLPCQRSMRFARYLVNFPQAKLVSRLLYLRPYKYQWFRWRRFIRRRRSKISQFRRLRRRMKHLVRIFPTRVIRSYRFIRKFRALFTVRALHTNLFFTIRQGTLYFPASTGMFEDLKRGTKRKRTLLAGWFLADRLFERAAPYLKEKSIFQVDLYGRTSGRRGIWFSWRTKPWRLFLVRSRTPVAFNGTRGCRRRRL